MCAMKMYADHRPRRVRQIAGDAFFVIWVFFWAWQGWSTHQSTMELTEPTERTEQAATDLGRNMQAASEALVGLPLVGDAASAPFSKAAESAQDLARAATAGKDGVHSLAVKSGLAIGLAPTAVLAGFYVPVRRRFTREATDTVRYLATTRDLDLFALRGLVNLSMEDLLQLSPDPAGAWRARDRDFVQRLAWLEVERCGVAPPFGPPDPTAT